MNNQTIQLPELDDATIARMEREVFTQIAAEASITPVAARPVVQRRRPWLTVLGVAAAFAVGVIVAPQLISLTGMGATVTSEAGGYAVIPESAPVEDSAGGTADGMEAVTGSEADTATEFQSSDERAAAAVAPNTDREIIVTANATVEAANAQEALDKITVLATEKGGFVENLSVGDYDLYNYSDTEAVHTDRGSISVRVPAAELNAVIQELGSAGEVLSSSLSKDDVTAVAIDLEARIEATRTSVNRLTELMAQAGSVADLLQAEGTLTERQGQLESLEQQLADIRNQVAMSSLYVEVVPKTITAEPEPSGFGDGLLNGWNGLIASVNALVVALGFALPWLAIAAVVFLIVWIARRAGRRNHTKALDR